MVGIFDPDRLSGEGRIAVYTTWAGRRSSLVPKCSISLSLGTLLSVLDSRWTGTAVMNGEGLGDQGPDPLEMSLGHPTRPTV